MSNPRISAAMIGAGVAFSLCAVAPNAAALQVATEVVLLADVSGSLDSADFALQRDGYVAAFRDAGVINTIVQSGPIAVTLVYWSDGQTQSVPWTLINDATTSNAFANAIAAAARPESGGTRLAAAMDYGTGAFANNGYEGSRLVMDVSGDGADSDSYSQIAPNVQAARDNALANGVSTINALWIDDRDFFGDDPQDFINALDYGADNVIGGISPFQDIVQDFPDFQAAIIAKIQREVVQPPNVPDGGWTSLLLGCGVFGILALRRRSA